MSYNILILEKDPQQATLMKKILQKSEELSVNLKLIASNKYLEGFLSVNDVNLIIVSNYISDSLGLKVLKIRDNLFTGIPVVIVSEKIGEENAIQLIKEGASDVIIKDNITSKLAYTCANVLQKQKNHINDVGNSFKKSYDLLFKNNLDPVILWSIEREGRILDANPAAGALLGYTLKELTKMSIYDLGGENKDIIQSITSTDKRTNVIWIKDKNGSFIQVQCKSVFENKNVYSVFRNFDVLEKESKTGWKQHALEIEKKLKIQYELNRQIINSLPGIFFIVNKEGQVLRTNKKFKRLFDFKEGSGALYTDFVANSSKSRAEKVFAKTFNEGNAEIELLLKTKDNELTPYLLSGTIDFIAGEKYLIGTGISIKKRVQAEEQLRKQQEFIETALDSLPGLFYVLDNNLNYIRVNKAFLDLLEYSWEEVKEMNPMDFYLEQDRGNIAESIKKAFNEGSATQVSRIKTKSGKLPHFLLTGSFFKQDNESYILGTGIDITQQKKLEELLEQAQRMAHIGAWELFLEDKKLSWTKTTNEIHEVAPDYNPNLELWIGFLKKGKSRNTFILALERAMNEGTPFDLELKIITQKGDQRWVRIIGEAEFLEKKIIRLFGSIQDIHDKKVNEERLKVSLEEKDVLLMEIHHRVKNNLALVSGFMQLQAYQAENELVFKYLSDNQTRIKSIALIHEQLYQSNNFSTINLKNTIKKLIEHLKSSILIENKDIEINYFLNEIAVNINQAIPFALVVNELVTNALKHAFREKNRGQIKISLLKSGDEIYFEVKDNGTGLPDNFNLEDPNSLGTTLIKTLSRQLKGHIRAVNSDSGAKFELTFKKVDSLSGSASRFLN